MHFPWSTGSLTQSQFNLLALLCKHDARLDPEALAITEVAVMFAGANLSLPDPSGQYNGCEGALGQKCAKRLIDAFKDGVSDGSSLFSATLEFKYQSDFATNLSCPWDIFNDVMAAGTTLAWPSR